MLTEQTVLLNSFEDSIFHAQAFVVALLDSLDVAAFENALGSAKASLKSAPSARGNAGPVPDEEQHRRSNHTSRNLVNGVYQLPGSSANNSDEPMNDLQRSLPKEREKAAARPRANEGTADVLLFL